MPVPGKKKFYIIVAIVAALLVGLIAVQLYWVKDAYRLKEVEYNNKLAAILDKAVAHINKKATYFYLYGRSYIKPGEGVMVLNTNSDTVKLFNAFPYDNKPDTCFYSTSISSYDALTMADVTMRFEYRQFDSVYNITERNKALQQMDSSNYKQRLDDTTDAGKLINVKALDSTMGALVYEAGFDSKYAYGVRKKGAHVFDITSDSSMQRALQASTHLKELFADRAFTKPFELVLFIENKDNIIRSTLMWTLTVSSVIILLLVGAFIYFFRTVLVQKRLSAMKTDFINNMTHEFMTPVTNIGLALETLEQKQHREEDKQRIMTVIATENAHLRENIDKVLQVAVLEKGSFLLNPAPVNLHEVLQRVARNFELPAKLKNGSFLFELHAKDPVIIADETHIINLFYNIIDNAVKYSGEAALLITMRSGQANNKLWVSIEDNGKGMNAQVQKNIFDKFYRGATGNVHDVKGFGLGLTYVKSIADAHNIVIDVKSNIDKGTIFTLWFSK